jgi:methyl-accepting chemotaxis protein
MTIRRRILVGFGSVIALLFVAGAYGTVVLRRAHRDLQGSTRAVIAVKNQLFASQEASRQYVVLAQNDLLRGGGRYVARMDSAGTLADSLRTQLSIGDAMSDAQRARLSQIAALQGRIGTRLAIARAHIDIGEPVAAAAQTDLAAALLDSLFNESRAVIETEDGRANAMLASANTRVSRQQLFVGILLAMGLAAAIAVGFLTLRAVTRPLDGLTAAARRLGDGNLQQAPESDGLDAEYHMLAQALADTTNRLAQLVREIQSEAQDVASSAEALTSASEAAAMSTNRMSGTMIEVTRAAEDQRAGVEGTRAVLADVRGASAVLESTADDTHQLEIEVRSLTDQARTGIGEALTVLTRARDVIHASLTNIERVEKASEIVQRFLQTIREISSRRSCSPSTLRSKRHARGWRDVGSPSSPTRCASCPTTATGRQTTFRVSSRRCSAKSRRQRWPSAAAWSRSATWTRRHVQSRTPWQRSRVQSRGWTS